MFSACAYVPVPFCCSLERQIGAGFFICANKQVNRNRLDKNKIMIDEKEKIILYLEVENMQRKMIQLDRVKLISIMAEKYVTRSELSQRSGVSGPTITAIRAGKNCTVTTAGKLAAGLGVPMERLVAE